MARNLLKPQVNLGIQRHFPSGYTKAKDAVLAGSAMRPSQ